MSVLSIKSLRFKVFDVCRGVKPPARLVLDVEASFDDSDSTPSEFFELACGDSGSVIMVGFDEESTTGGSDPAATSLLIVARFCSFTKLEID